MQITILGSGSSLGVPVIGCLCSTCLSDSEYNKRTRSSIFISDSKVNLLVDFGFDIKSQLLKSNITKLDAAILTHNHADHIAGIDDLKVFSWINNAALKLHVDAGIISDVRDRYNYLFAKKYLTLNPINFFSSLNVKGTTIDFFPQYHGDIISVGIKIDSFVYSSDVNDFPHESMQYLYNLKVWIVDCIGFNSTKSHAGVDKILIWYKKYNPHKMFLTNMSHDLDYHIIKNKLPSAITPLYDGYKIDTNIL